MQASAGIDNIPMRLKYINLDTRGMRLPEPVMEFAQNWQEIVRACVDCQQNRIYILSSITAFGHPVNHN